MRLSSYRSPLTPSALARKVQRSIRSLELKDENLVERATVVQLLSENTHLFQLSLAHCYLNEKAFSLLARCPKLIHLIIAPSKSTAAADFKAIITHFGKKLTALSVESLDPLPFEMAQTLLQGIPALREFSINRWALIPASSPLHFSSSLIALHNIPLDTRVSRALAALPQLQTLSVSLTGTKAERNEQLSSLALSSSLTSLSIRHIDEPVSLLVFKSLLTCPHLTSLEIVPAFNVAPLRAGWGYVLTGGISSPSPSPSVSPAPFLTPRSPSSSLPLALALDSSPSSTPHSSSPLFSSSSSSFMSALPSSAASASISSFVVNNDNDSATSLPLSSISSSSSSSPSSSRVFPSSPSFSRLASCVSPILCFTDVQIARLSLSWFGHTHAESEDLAALSHLPSLHSLSIRDTDLNSLRLYALSRITSLTHLSLSLETADVSEQAVEFLASMRHLTTTSIQMTGNDTVSPVVCERLAALPSLSSVALCYSDLNEAIVTNLSKNSALSYVRLVLDTRALNGWKKKLAILSHSPSIIQFVATSTISASSTDSVVQTDIKEIQSYCSHIAHRNEIALHNWQCISLLIACSRADDEECKIRNTLLYCMNDIMRFLDRADTCVRPLHFE